MSKEPLCPSINPARSAEFSLQQRSIINYNDVFRDSDDVTVFRT
jgi:hypothetical protein